MSVPSFAAEVTRQRLGLVGHEAPDHLLFFTRNGKPLTTNNIRRRLRAVLLEVGIEGVTPHAFRRTVATVLDRASWPALAAELLGHTSSKITKEHYIQPDEAVDPVTAEILESLAPKRGGTVVSDDVSEPTPLPNRNAMHYDGRVFERVDWSQRGAYMQGKHGITPAVADEAFEDQPGCDRSRLQQRERQERQDHRSLGDRR